MSKQHVVVVGLGRWGKNLVRNFSELGVLYGVSDCSPQLKDQFASLYSVPALTVEEALADPMVTAIAIATPVAQHHAIASQALAAGKHVWVEKPVCFDAGQCKDLLAMSQQQARCVFVDYLPVYHPAIQSLKKQLMQQPQPDGQQVMIEAQRKAWGVWREEGVIWDLMCHDLAMIKYLFPDLQFKVKNIESRRFYSRSEFPDYAKVTIESPGYQVVVEASCVHAVKTQQLYVSLADRAYLLDAQAGNQALSVYHLQHEPMQLTQELVDYPANEPLRAAVEHFLACIDEGHAPLTDLHFALEIENFIRGMHQELELING